MKNIFFSIFVIIINFFLFSNINITFAFTEKTNNNYNNENDMNTDTTMRMGSDTDYITADSKYVDDKYNHIALPFVKSILAITMPSSPMVVGLGDRNVVNKGRTKIMNTQVNNNVPRINQVKLNGFNNNNNNNNIQQRGSLVKANVATSSSSSSGLEGDHNLLLLNSESESKSKSKSKFMDHFIAGFKYFFSSSPKEVKSDDDNETTVNNGNNLRMETPPVKADDIDTYMKLKEDLTDLIQKESCAPIMVRLAWHDAGTYDKETKTGGANGSIRFDKESEHGANAGLKWIMEKLEPFKKKYPSVGYADLYQFASVVAVEVTGGPKIPFFMGRKDATEEEQTPDGRLPDANKAEMHLRDVFNRMGFDDREIVVLSGAHTLGKAHKDRSGFEGKWTQEEHKFDNSYFKELVKKEKDPSLLQLPTDTALANVPDMFVWVDEYANDNDLFFKDYALAHQKLSELGSENLIGPV